MNQIETISESCQKACFENQIETIFELCRKACFEIPGAILSAGDDELVVELLRLQLAIKKQEIVITGLLRRKKQPLPFDGPLLPVPKRKGGGFL